MFVRGVHTAARINATLPRCFERGKKPPDRKQQKDEGRSYEEQAHVEEPHPPHRDDGCRKDEQARNRRSASGEGEQLAEVC